MEIFREIVKHEMGTRRTKQSLAGQVTNFIF